MGRNKGCREHGIEPAWSCLICNSPKGSARRIIYGGSITVTDAMADAGMKVMAKWDIYRGFVGDQERFVTEIYSEMTAAAALEARDDSD